MAMPTYTDSDIKTLTALEDFRINSSQYVGSGGIDTDVQLLLEIILNATDEAIDPTKQYLIKVIFFTDGVKYQVAVQDHGRGIPLKKLEDVYTQRSTSGKFDAKAYNGISAGCWGVGSKLTNALSDHFISISKRPDGFAGIRFKRGVTEQYRCRRPLNKDVTTDGTTVIYQTDPTICKETHLYMTDQRGLQETLRQLEFMSVFRPNVKFVVYQVNTLLAEDWFNQTFEEQWKYVTDFSGDIIYQSPTEPNKFEYAKRVCNVTEATDWSIWMEKPINVDDDKDRVGYDIMFGLTKHPEKESGILGIVNGNIINDPKASHILGAQSAIKTKLIQYIDEDDTDLKSFFLQTYQIPFHGYVKVTYKGAKFVNQKKDSFISSDFLKLYVPILKDALEANNDSVYETLFALITPDLEKKYSQNMGRVLSTGKSLKNVTFELKRGESYFACETRDKNLASLNIVEGLSSGNWATQQRDPSFQAVYELRGKCLNTFTSSPDAWKKDDVYMDLVRLLGVHPKDTNLDNMNFKEVVILADADPDGLSITNLLLGMFYNINPLILDQGRVKIAMPPLYVLSTRKNTKFLRDQNALDDLRVDAYRLRLDLGVSVNGGPIEILTDDKFRDAIYMILNVTSKIEEVSRKLAIDPFVVEQMCHCTDFIRGTKAGKLEVDTQGIRNLLGLDDCIFSKNSMVLTLVYQSLEVSVPLDRLMNEINIYLIPLLESVNWRMYDLYLSTKLTNTYQNKCMMFWQIKQVLDVLDHECDVSRIKGLGECPADVLKYTCLDPGTRTVVTVYGLGDVDTIFAMLGVETSARKQLVSSDMDAIWRRGEL